MLNEKWLAIVDTIEFAFQPIVSIKSGKLYAVEALLRNHDKAGNYNSIFALFDDAFEDGVLYQYQVYTSNCIFLCVLHCILDDKVD